MFIYCWRGQVKMENIHFMESSCRDYWWKTAWEKANNHYAMSKSFKGGRTNIFKAFLEPIQLLNKTFEKHMTLWWWLSYILPLEASIMSTDSAFALHQVKLVPNTLIVIFNNINKHRHFQQLDTLGSIVQINTMLHMFICLSEWINNNKSNI